MKSIIKFTGLLFFMLIILFSNNILAQNYLDEDFENAGQIPDGWSQQYDVGSAPWKFQYGGFEDFGGLKHPENPYEGSYNAFFYYGGEFTTKLVSPSINLEDAIKPALEFAYTITEYNGSFDQLDILFKQHIDSSWMTLKQYQNKKVEAWKVETIYLPDTLLTSNCYIAFKAKSLLGAGICIDSVVVVEKNYITKRVDTIIVKTATTNLIPTGAKTNPILRIDFDVVGNSGNVTLDSLAIKSLNTSDSDISPSGVKLFYTEDTLFTFPVQIGTEQDFSGGITSFTNLNQPLPYGITSIWVCYDIKVDVNHEMQGHIADAMIEANSIKINNHTYPDASESPDGKRVISESVFFEDFETDKGWIFGGEFERGAPQGKGFSGLIFTPDPEEAHSGTNIIGTDLSGDGDYEPSISSKRDSAISPLINAKYYKDVHLTFYRWLNLDDFDSTHIDISNNGDNWSNVWIHEDYEYDNKWQLYDYNISSKADRKENIKIRFTLGPTDGSIEAGGWNIDDIALVGNYIAGDVGVVSWRGPLGGCGYGSEEYVEIAIKNYAGETLTDPLIVSYSFDDGATIKYDTIANPNIPSDGTINYTIDKPVDLTTSGWYNNVYASTNLDKDEDNSNNRLNTRVFISPTKTLPYTEKFDNNFGFFYQGKGTSTWEYGKPAGVLIDTAASGNNAWVTNLDGDYPNNDSAFLETPCFNMSGINLPMVDFMMFSESEKNSDGMAFYYSINNGQNWTLVNKRFGYNWNWYNNNSHSAFGHAAWDTTTTDWIRVKQILPEAVTNQSSVKFKFLFKSNVSGINEGFAIDNFKIYQVPYDVGVTNIAYPFTQCNLTDTTHVKVYVENYGVDTIMPGTQIPIGLDFKNSYVFTDTMTVLSEINPGDSVLFQLDTVVDMSNKGDYNIKAYTLLEQDPYFYNPVCNDTSSKTVTVQGMPKYNPFNDQIGANPVTSVTLNAGTGYDAYSWEVPLNPSNPSNQTWDVVNEGWHKVTVTLNASPSDCYATDSTYLIESEVNLLMDSLYTELEDSCVRNSLTELSVHFINKNINSAVLAVNDVIRMGYQINNQDVVNEDLTITKIINVDDTVWYTFSTPCDLREVGEYTIKVFTDVQKDLDHANDTITKTVNTLGVPQVELAYDTIYSSQADTLELDAGPGFSSYAWNSGSSGQKETPSNKSYYYKVTVSSTGCGTDTDSTYIETHDLGITNIISPADVCVDDASASTNLNVVVKNYSENVYSSSETVKIFYNYDNGGWTEANPQFGSELSANGNVNVSIGNINTTSIGEHTIQLYTSSDIDANHSNDTLEYSFNTWPLADVNLAYDTIKTTRADTVKLIAQPGFASYSWSNGSSNDTLTITDLKSQYYIVTVVDIHGCNEDKDSTYIMTYDLGVSQFITPVSDCENTTSEPVKISVKNYGKDIIQSSETIDIYFQFNGGSILSESITLNKNLNAGDTVNHQFATSVNMQAEGIYDLKAYLSYDKDINSKNDVLEKTVKTAGYPSLSIDDIYTKQADTVVIALDEELSYIWSNGVINDTLEVTYPASEHYSVTATDIIGCSTTEEFDIYTYDVKVSSLLSPVSQCSFTNTEPVEIKVINDSKDTLLTGETIELAYKLNSESVVNESFNLTETLYPDSTFEYTFTQTADLSANQTHALKAFAKRAGIDVFTDDTLTSAVDNKYPDIDLGADVNTSGSDYTINAGAGFSSYEWFDGSDLTSYTVNINNQTTNRYYAVTVSNAEGCYGSDSVRVLFSTKADLRLQQLISPISECWQKGKDYQVKIRVENVGVVNLASGTSFTVGYKIDDGTAVKETYTLTSNMNTNDTREHTFASSIDFSSPKVYRFKPFVSLFDDGNINNDTIIANVDISAPDVDLGSDTIYFNDSYEVQTLESYKAYKWNTGSTESTIEVTESGTYSVTVTDNNGCQGTDKIVCLLLTGIDNVIKGENYSVKYYPNPAHEKLIVEFDNLLATDAVIEIININGQVLYNNKFSKVRNSLETIDVNSFIPGIYYIRFTIDKELYTKKLLIQ